MIALLDTSVFIWLCKEPVKLSPRVLEICEDKSNILLLSVASVWEIQIKTQLGKLKFEMEMIEAESAQNGLKLVSIDLTHIYGLKNLPSIHGDPFDRIIIAQARELNATVLSKDARFSSYPINVIW